MKIKPCFLELIKTGKKKHEYRLYTPDRSSLSIGDQITLVSNENLNDTLVVTITDISIHPNWLDALKDYWKEDFEGLFNNLDDLINECNKFYSPKQVREFGIVRFKMLNLDDDNNKSKKGCVTNETSNKNI